MPECNRIDVMNGIDINKQMHKKNVIFVTFGILKILVLSVNYISAMVVMI